MSTSGQVYWVVGAVGLILCWAKMNQSQYPINLALLGCWWGTAVETAVWRWRSVVGAE